MFKVNISNEDTLIKKLARMEKRKQLKRKYQEQEEETELPEYKPNRDDLVKLLRNNEYELSIHFSKKVS